MKLDPERMALETHPKGSEGVYEDNLPWVTGVEVEIKKAKRYDDDGECVMYQGRGKERRKKTRSFFLFEKEKIRGPTRFEVRTANVPRQQRQKACWVF